MYAIILFEFVFTISCVFLLRSPVNSFTSHLIIGKALPGIRFPSPVQVFKADNDDRIIISNENSRRYDLKTIGAIIASQTKLDGNLTAATADFLESERKLSKKRLPGDVDAQVTLTSNILTKSTISKQVGVISTLMIAKKSNLLQPKQGNRRSEILDAALMTGKNGKFDSYDIKIKLTKDFSRYQREVTNYRNIVGPLGSQSDNSKFIVRYFCDSHSTAPISDSGGEYAIYMESGEICLRDVASSASSKNQQMRLRAIKVAAMAMVNVLDTIHSKGLVWGDFKLDNFILVPTTERKAEVDRQIIKNLYERSRKAAAETDYVSLLVRGQVQVKAIDLESLTPRGEPLRDFSPETLPPEHATLISQGSLKMMAPGDFKLGADHFSPFKTLFWLNIFASGGTA